MNTMMNHSNHTSPVGDFGTENCCEPNETLLTSYPTLVHDVSYLMPCLVVLLVATVVGTFGNVMILALMYTRKGIQSVETTFIVNLAISDLYVTAITDPMSFIGMYWMFDPSLVISDVACMTSQIKQDCK